MSDPVVRLNAALEGRYAIERELGEGGMATVYLAEDIKHNRKVALKVLKPELAAVVGAERFLAEIQVTANLQHPHILPLFDSGEADSFLFYVMPYVEGETLRDRIKREKQLPVDEAVGIATAVANALDYAHRHKVIHRDIKPANILIQDGEPVVSDFGIALALGAGGGDRLTETGLSLGTPYYMSPEQATGDQPVGSSTDTYALGSVLYEMLVGEPPYPGTTTQAVLGKIIAGKPVSAREHRSSVPGNVDAAIRCAIEKLPADRFTSAQDFVRALEEPGFRHGEVAVAEVTAAVGPWKRLAVGFAVLAGLFGLGFGWSLLRPAPPQAAASRFRLTAPAGVRIGGPRGLAASPDGRTVVFADGPTGQLYHRDAGQLDATPIPGAEDAWYPFFSPDGEWVAYFTLPGGALRKVRLDGSQAQTIAPVPGTLRSAGWGSDGTIVLAATSLEGLWRVRDTGGELEQIANTEGPQLRWLDLLPNGRAVLGGTNLDGVRQVVAVSLETGERTVLFVGTTPRYVASGYVVFWREEVLWAARFDPERLTALGPPIPIIEGVPAQGNGLGEFAVGGDLLFHGEGEGFSGLTLVLVDRAGRAQPLSPEPQQYSYPRLSPDGGRLAVAVVDNTAASSAIDLWVFDLDRGSRSRITFGGDNRYYPVWTPEGDRLAFSDGNFDANRIQIASADGSGQTVALLEREGRQFPTSWSSDGSLLAFHENHPETLRDLWVLPVGGDPEPFLVTPFQEGAPVFSPDGRWLAYVSDKSGQTEVYVQPYPGPGPEFTVSNAGGREPLWSPDGSELFYRARDQYMVVAVELGETFLGGTPQPLFPNNYLPGNTPTSAPNYDITPDGQRFVMVRPGGSEAYTAVVVLNFSEQLRRVVPD